MLQSKKNAFQCYPLNGVFGFGCTPRLVGYKTFSSINGLLSVQVGVTGICENNMRVG